MPTSGKANNEIPVRYRIISPMEKSVLIIGPHRKVHDQLDDLWVETNLEKQRFTSTDAALEMVQDGYRPDLVVVSYPLFDTSIENLLAALGRTLPRNPTVPVLILAAEEVLFEVAAYEDRGVTVLADGNAPEEIGRSLRGLLKVEQRAHPRFIVQMSVRVGAGSVLRACQSEDISLSGMLIRTSEEFPVGSEVRLEFALSGDQGPIACQALVVRYTKPDIEKIRGMGVNFISFEADGLKRLERFLST